MEMEQIKIQSLLSYLGETEESVEIEVAPYGDNQIVVIDNMEYAVLTEEEAKKRFYEYQMDLITDLGFEAFGDWAKEEILQYHTTQDCQKVFNEIMEETQQSYIEDLRYMDALEQEMKHFDCSDEGEFLEYLCQEDSEEWFKFNFGEQEFERILIEHNLIDWDSVIEWLEDMDGRGCLSGYDGDELELDNNLFAYRIN